MTFVIVSFKGGELPMQAQRSIELESVDLVASAIEEEEDLVISKGKERAR